MCLMGMVLGLGEPRSLRFMVAVSFYAEGHFPAFVMKLCVVLLLGNSSEKLLL